jgi:hypothetical protein
MERELCIFEMSDAANLMSLVRSRLLQDHFPQEYAATWARRAIILRSVLHSNDDLWSFVMLPDAQPVSAVPLLPLGPCFAFLFVLMIFARSW